MIKRIVLMELPSEKEALFLDIFDHAKDEIRSQKGCMGLELLKNNEHGKSILCTISFWNSETDLENYRSSDLFQSTWAAVKPLFSDRARAWTLKPVETLA